MKQLSEYGSEMFSVLSSTAGGSIIAADIVACRRQEEKVFLFCSGGWAFTPLPTTKSAIFECGPDASDEELQLNWLARCCDKTLVFNGSFAFVLAVLIRTIAERQRGPAHDAKRNGKHRRGLPTLQHEGEEVINVGLVWGQFCSRPPASVASASASVKKGKGKDKGKGKAAVADRHSPSDAAAASTDAQQTAAPALTMPFGSPSVQCVCEIGVLNEAKLEAFPQNHFGHAADLASEELREVADFGTKSVLQFFDQHGIPHEWLLIADCRLLCCMMLCCCAVVLLSWSGRLPKKGELPLVLWQERPLASTAYVHCLMIAYWLLFNCCCVVVLLCCPVRTRCGFAFGRVVASSISTSLVLMCCRCVWCCCNVQ